MSLPEHVARPTRLGMMLLSAFAACSLFTDAAVDLAACINRAADRMRSSRLDSLQIDCPIRGQRTVTLALFPTGALASATDSQKASALRQLGLPNDAIFYNGPDSPSIGHFVSLGPVYAYDGGYLDNRKYSTTSSLASYVRIAKPMATSGNHFAVELRRTDAGAVEIIGLH